MQNLTIMKLRLSHFLENGYLVGKNFCVPVFLPSINGMTDGFLKLLRILTILFTHAYNNGILLSMNWFGKFNLVAKSTLQETSRLKVKV